MSTDVIIEQQERIVTITLNRTAKKNALTQAMYSEMTEALQQADNDPNVAVVVIKGAADSFTAGNDLHDFLNMEQLDNDTPAFKFLYTLAALEVPLVAAVNGLAIGIGTTLLMHCDLVYASEDAQFSLPFINLGLVPEAASSLLLPQACGHLRAAELLLLGDRFDAHHAKACGIVNDVVSSDQLDAKVDDVVKALASKPVAGLRSAKTLLKTPAEPVAQRIERELNIFAKALASPEAKAVIAKVLQKK